jgi:hypothetical protein
VIGTGRLQHRANAARRRARRSAGRRAELAQPGVTGKLRPDLGVMGRRRSRRGLPGLDDPAAAMIWPVPDHDPYAMVPAAVHPYPIVPAAVPRWAHRLLLFGLLIAWALVACVELVHIFLSPFTLLIFPVELIIWGVAVLLTVICVKQRSRPAGVRMPAVAGFVTCLAWAYFTNWSVLEPHSYYAVHRSSFAEVAEMVENGDFDQPDDYDGRPLPWYLADLSTTGKAATIGREDGKPVVLLPEFLGMPDGGLGYVYFTGDPESDSPFDLFGDPLYLADAEPLGDGWWYTRNWRAGSS